MITLDFRMKLVQVSATEFNIQDGEGTALATAQYGDKEVELSTKDWLICAIGVSGFPMDDQYAEDFLGAVATAFGVAAEVLTFKMRNYLAEMGPLSR